MEKEVCPVCGSSDWEETTMGYSGLNPNKRTCLECDAKWHNVDYLLSLEPKPTIGERCYFSLEDDVRERLTDLVIRHNLSEDEVVEIADLIRSYR